MTTKNNAVRDSLNMHDLLSALPEDLQSKENIQDDLAELIKNISVKPIPTGSLSRMWTLGSMQAKIAMGYFAYAVRSQFVSKSEQQKLLNEANLKAAVKLFGTMGYLRGAIMKIGQMLTNLPHILPTEFSDVLSSLHFEAPPMHYSMIREVFLDELGNEPQNIFASFDRKAFAAASLGQVHKARLKTGEEVAVKIQYPNLQHIIASDIRNLKTLMLPMRFKNDWDYIFAHIEDAERMLKVEADYLQEAKFMQTAYELFKDKEEIIVPRYYKHFSSSRVLTMDYISGKHLKNFIKENPSQRLRDHFGKLISTAIINLTYSSGIFYTDPHPGNFLLTDDARLGFIDFGSFRKLTPEQWRMTNNGEKALMLSHDEKLLDESLAYGCFYDTIEEMSPKKTNLLKKCLQWHAEPALKDAPFDFGSEEWYQRGMDIYLAIAKQRHTRFRPAYNWTNKSILCHRNLMYRLKSKFNFRKVYFENNPCIKLTNEPLSK